MKAKQIKVFETILVVRGSGDFPFDMLRYDHCFPAREDESSKLAGHEARTVVLIRRAVSRGATIARWRSFGWDVVNEDENVERLGDVLREIEALGEIARRFG